MRSRTARRVRRTLGWVSVAGGLLAVLGAGRALAEPASGSASIAPRQARAAAAHVRRAPKPPASRARPKVARRADGRASALVVAPVRPDARRVTVMLHGMCDEPENECPYFAGAVSANSWLVCPRARLRCEGGGSIWPWQTFDSDVEASVTELERDHPGQVDAARGRTLIGFSLGAIRGMDLAHAGAGRYRAVILIGAKIHPDPRRLRAAGVERLLLAAGDHDMMKAHMAREARRLERAGFPAAFMSLGPVGHWFPGDFSARLERAIGWTDGDDGAFVPSALGEVAWRPKPDVAGASDSPRRGLL
jgi:predicted esterase